MHRQKGKRNTPQVIINEIVRMHREDGVSVRELAQMYSMPYKTLKNMVTRENNKILKMNLGISPRRPGRPSKTNAFTELNKSNEIKKLKMENELLRDFLRAAGRR